MVKDVKIEVSAQDICEITNEFGASSDTIYKALSFKRNGSLSRRIRVFAVNVLGCSIINEKNIMYYEDA